MKAPFTEASNGLLGNKSMDQVRRQVWGWCYGWEDGEEERGSSKGLIWASKLLYVSSK